MFLVTLTYIKPLEQVDKFLNEHGAFLDKYYAAQKFIFSGRRNPRIGGVILINSNNESEVRQILGEDPFHQHGIAEYELMEFTPTKYDARFAMFVESERSAAR